MITLALVVAMAQNRVIGRNNALPWRLPEDLRYFKSITMGHPLVMGRKTYESIGRPLPGRTNIVLTRQQDWRAEGVTVSHSMDEAISVAERQARQDGVDQIMVIGGAEFYIQALKRADRLYLTKVHANFEGDATFPEYDKSEWEEVSRRDINASKESPYAYSFIVLDKIGNAGGD